MGTKIKKEILTILVFLVTINLYSQKKEVVKELKTFALCSCVNKNYSQIDSTFYSSDVTNSYILQSSPLSIDQYERFSKFIDDKTKDMYKEIPYGSYDAPKANMIFYFCLEFYESKQLDNFIKKMLKEKVTD